MKKLILLLFAVIPMLVFSQKAKIEFETTSHNFGTISENGGNVTYDFVFKNTGNSPLILTEVRASCGCTTPQWNREPILPNASGTIKVSYNPKNRPNAFTKSITVKSNAENPIVGLTIRGKVEKKPSDPYAAYTYQIGTLKLSSATLNLGSVRNTDNIEKTMSVINTGTSPVKLAIVNDIPYIKASMSPETLNKGEIGKIVIKYNVAQKNDWGFVSDKIELKTDHGANGAIGIVANITEDFSQYGNNEYSNAPVASFSETEAELGILVKNAVKKHEFFIQNTGKSDLIIRKIKASDTDVSVLPSKMVVKPGKKTKVVLTLKTDDKPGKKVKIISFTLNDPRNTIISYKLSGNIQ